MNRLKIVGHIVRHTVMDQMRQKSFLVIFVICALFMTGLRSCYHGNYTVNNQQVMGGEAALMVSKAAFNIVTTIAMMIAALLSMRILRRERDEGTQSVILSKPVSRAEYLAGKIGGLWLLVFAFMFLLHAIIFIIGFASTGEPIPGYLLASLICAINILFVVAFVLLLSLYLPDFVCFLIVTAIGAFGLIGDAMYTISQHQAVQQAVSSSGTLLPDMTVWKAVYLAMPRISGVQLYASSMVTGEAFTYVGPVHPLLDVVLYCGVTMGLLFFLFRRQDIA